ncbi:MAG TPA: hypothetical protein DCQ04_00445, partial [Actinobacteria bacterium]|nr:hypothetical protein [Actinomycetota bacterium]
AYRLHSLTLTDERDGGENMNNELTQWWDRRSGWEKFGLSFLGCTGVGAAAVLLAPVAAAAAAAISTVASAAGTAITTGGAVVTATTVSTTASGVITSTTGTLAIGAATALLKS